MANQGKQLKDFDPAATPSDADVLYSAQGGVEKGMLFSQIKAAIAQWVIGTYQGFTQSGAGAVARTVQAKMSDFIDLRDFGAKGDGTTDDTAAIAAAIAAAVARNARLHLPVPAVYYRISSTLNFRNIVVDGAGSIIYVNTPAIGVILGGTATNGTNPDQSIGTVYRNTGLSGANPSVQVIGAKGQRITAKYVDYLQVWADTTNSADGSSAYSTFYLNWADRLDLTAGPNGGWINENEFFLNRCHTLNVVGSTAYTFNHNRWRGGSFEGVASIYFNYAYDNKMEFLRFEQGPTTITFDTNSDRNTLIKTWASSEYSGWPNTPLISGTITNNGGGGNCVVNEQQMLRDAVIVAESDTSDVVLNNTFSTIQPENTRTISLQYVGGTSGNVPVCMSDYLAVQRDDYYVYAWENANSGDTPLYRAALYFYDANYQPITVQSSWVVSQSITSISSNIIRSSVGAGSGAFGRVTQAAIAGGAVFVRAVIEASNAQLTSALARRVYVTLFSLNATQNRANIAAKKASRTGLYAVSAIPTQGYAPLGYMCVNTSFTARYHCTSTSDTTLSVAGTNGATSITVTTVSQFASGDVLGINMDDRSTFWTTVSGAPVGNVVTLAAALPTTAALGNRVVRNRWRTETLSVS